MDKTLIESAANRIRAARQTGRISDLPPDLIPRDEAQAYAIQDILLPAEEIAGWKVAPASPTKGHRGSPMSVQAVIPDGGALPQSAVAPEVEGEVGFVLSKPVPLDGTREDVLDAIAGLCLAIEVLDSCFTDRKCADPMSALADFQSNAGVVIGPLKTDLTGLDLSRLRPVFLTSDGETLEPAKPMALTEAVLDAVLWLARHAARRDRPLQPGQVVITGARVGPVPIARGQTFRVEADGFQGAAIRRD
ncbi:2-keto-4-pentenoate hydratase [Halovulum marinum]|nr:fumarylacetoacetate hydrolase family protein [Halovulum marinum]